MPFRMHPELRVQKLTIGRESQPLVVIDNVVADPEELVRIAASKAYAEGLNFYPGIRAKSPLTYNDFVTQELRSVFAGHFGLAHQPLRITSCHFSLVTTSPRQLAHMQTIPHIDSPEPNHLAFVHYLFKRDLGGTAFYRHRRTGFEYVDHARRAEYFASVAEEKDGPDRPAVGYINGDTPLYEQFDRQDGVFNRMLVYRRTSLHSGCIGPDFHPDPDPRTGRLSLNGFMG